MTPGWRPGPWLRAALLVGGGTVLVSAGGVLWSVLRVGDPRLTYVREAQFLAGIVLLLAWAVRNRSAGREPGAASERGRSRRPAAGGDDTMDRGGGRSGAVPGGDAALLALGLLLVIISIVGELVG